MTGAGPVASAVLSVTGLAGAAVSQAAGGPDYIGIATVITAISGLVGTVGMLVLNYLKQRDGNKRRKGRR